MDRNSVIGLALIAGILIIYSIFLAPEPKEKPAQTSNQTDTTSAEKVEEEGKSEAAQERDTTENEQESQQAGFTADETVEDTTYKAFKRREMMEKYGALAANMEGEEETLTIENDKFTVDLSNKGARITKVVLKDYVTYDSLPLVLWDIKHADFNIPLPLGDEDVNTRDLYFDVEGSSTTLNGEDTQVITFTAGDGQERLELIYKFFGDKYHIDFEARFEGLSDRINTPERIKLNMSQVAYAKEKSPEQERNKSAVYFRTVDDGRDYLSDTDEDEEVVEEKLDWMAFKQLFFSVIVFTDKPFSEGAMLKSKPIEEPGMLESYSAEMPLPLESVDNSSVDLQLYFGPNKYSILKTYGEEVDRIIDLGWGIFGWVNKWMVIPIFDFLNDFIQSYGIIILILTIFIKLLLFPLTYKNYLSSAKMKVLRPEMEEINEKYKDADPMKKQQATMDLYRKTGVNPFAGCIPLIIQLPILYAMFRFFPSSIELRQKSFLWAEDLSSYDSIAQLPFHIPAYGDHVSLFTLLMCGSTLIYTMYNTNQMATTTQPGMPNMKVMMYIFPIMMLFFFNSFASGLSYYYFLANLISIIQMLIIKKLFIDEDKIHAQIQENKKRPGAGKKSKFQQRLEQMSKQQQQRRKS